MSMFKPYFADENAAREHLESIRWPSGSVCPHCGGTERNSKLQGEAHRPGLLFCGDCRQQFTVTVGTVFERSKIPLNKWIYAVHLMCSSKKGVSAKQLERMLKVTYKTAWFMAHRIREAMTSEGGVFGGSGAPVEADETYWGNKSKHVKGVRGWHHSMKVLSLVERDGQKQSFQVSNVNAETLRSILKARIAEKATLMTDDAKWYRPIGREFGSHKVVNHSKGEYTRGDVTTNTVESSFAILKRGLYGTYHHVSEAHLQRYANEFDFRWNTREKMGYNDTQRTAEALKGIGGKRLTYRRMKTQAGINNS